MDSLFGSNSGWCWPSVIFLIVFVIGIIGSWRMVNTYKNVLPNQWYFFWASLLIGLGLFIWLFGLCKSGNSKAAWTIILILAVIYLLGWIFGGYRGVTF